jgi:hypothetical protein
VRPLIEATLGDVSDVEVIVYEPTAKYQNVAKKQGVEKLTPARVLIAEAVRRYWVLGIECTLLEVQKLAWFLERSIHRLGLQDPLELRFAANRYGPYAHRLTKLLEGLDGSYLHCDKRLADAGAFDTIWFEDAKRGKLELYLKSAEAQEYVPALEATDALIDGFQSPLGMEALATVDWLLGARQQLITLPAWLSGRIDLGFVAIGVYRLFLIGVCGVIGVCGAAAVPAAGRSRGRRGGGARGGGGPATDRPQPDLRHGQVRRRRDERVPGGPSRVAKLLLGGDRPGSGRLLWPLADN